MTRRFSILAAICAFAAACAPRHRDAEPRPEPAPEPERGPGRAAAGAPGGAPEADAAPSVRMGDGRLLGKGPDRACFPVCGFAHLTDPDEHGNLDGFGYEGQRPCIAAGTTPELYAPACDVVELPNLPPPGNGVFRETRCVPICGSGRTDRDPATGRVDGWGYERGRNCIVAGTAAALGGVSCDPGEPPFVPGDGVRLVVDAAGKRECRPLCHDPTSSDPDGDGFGYEHETSCVASNSLAALQGVPCDAPDLPPPRPPPPPPSGPGWRSDYTATAFGELDCARHGFDDPGDSDLNRSTCVSSGQVELDEDNQTYFAATGDLSSLWQGPPCSCSGPSRGGRCRTPPSCPGQTNCGQCLEVTCNFEGEHSFRDDGMTHNELCRPGRSVVVQLIDACPHNHPNNPYWCTRDRREHVDLSCSAFAALTRGRDVGSIGSINVHVRRVDCTVGLGVKNLP